VAGVAALGGRAGFIGKVRDDQLGHVFTHDIRSIGVEYDTPPATSGPATARCLVMVTPDAHRTMNTYLGAATGLAAADVQIDLIERSAVTYMEGYLWDPPEAIDALRTSMAAAHGAGRRVAFTLSDPFCVDRHRDEFLDVISEEVDLLFANEHEAQSLFEVDSLDQVIKGVQGICEMAVVTRGPDGCLVVHPDGSFEVPAVPTKVVDTTGAGDLFAAGFLYGITHGFDERRSAELGAKAAAEVISHIGARPEIDLKTLLCPRVPPSYWVRKRSRNRTRPWPVRPFSELATNAYRNPNDS
jgi:sugar/nucleoside kinase (ribokinase family)